MAEAPDTLVVDDPDVPRSKKSFIPLENNPEVMDALVHNLGLSESLSWNDIYSIDDPELLAFAPRPALALLLVFPVTKSYEEHRMKEDAHIDEYAGSGPDEPVIWYKQTIRNACGLIGLLHAVSNGGAKQFIDPSSDLAKLIAEALPLGPAERADLLYDSKALENAHKSAANQGQTNAPGAEDDVDLHFVCFVKSDVTNHLWELDGRRKGPIERGVLGPDEDVLSPKALDLGVRKFLNREKESGGELRFSLVALAPSLD